MDQAPIPNTSSISACWTRLSSLDERWSHFNQGSLTAADVSRTALSKLLCWPCRNPQDRRSTFPFESPRTDCNMAILEDLGLEVKIIVNGAPLQEYEDKEADLSDDGFGGKTRKCRRYVEVDGDTEFGVQLHVTPNNNYLDGNKQKRLRFCLDLDGQEELEARLMNLACNPVLLDGKDEYNGWTLVSRRFRFTTISTGTYPEALVLVREILTLQQ